MTSDRAQVGRLRRLGVQALAAFPVTEPVLTFGTDSLDLLLSRTPRR
jgi:hypothetical protein